MLIQKAKRGELSTWECDVCKKHFKVKTNRATEAFKKKQNKFCSKDCKTIYWREEASKRVIKHVKENGHAMFKGGIGVTTDGYIWIRIKGKGYHGNQIKLHRYLMQVKLGRELKASEIVHHIDEDKFNNNIDNLQLTTISEHNRIHGHFKKDKRSDIWKNKEIKIVLSNLPIKEKMKLLPNRTKNAIYSHKNRLKKLKS